MLVDSNKSVSLPWELFNAISGKKFSVNQHGRVVTWLQTKSFAVYCKDGFPLWRNSLRVYARKMYVRK